MFIQQSIWRIDQRLWKPRNVYTGSYKKLSWRITFPLENGSWWFMMEGVMFSKFDSKEIELTFAPIAIEKDRLFKFDNFQLGSHLRFSLWNITRFPILTTFWRLINIWEAQPHEFSLVQGYFVDFSRTVRGEPQPHTDARFAKIRASHLHQNTKNNLPRFCGQNDGYVSLNAHRCSTVQILGKIWHNLSHVFQWGTLR